MALISSTGGYRAFSMTKEATLGVPATVNTSVNYKGDLWDVVPKTLWTNKDENTGEIAPTTQQIMTYTMTAKHDQMLTSHIASLLFSWFLGNCTSSAGNGTAFKHKMVADKTMISQVTRTCEEYDGYQRYQYPGVACTGISIGGKREDWITISGDFLGMGQETGILIGTRPTQNFEPFLKYGDCTLKRGGTYDGTTVTGGTDVSARLHEFKLDVKWGTKAIYNFGDNTGFAGAFIRGRMLDASLSAKFDFADASEKNAMIDGTKYVLEIPIIGGAIAGSTDLYTVRLVLPCVTYKKAGKKSDDGLLTLDAEFEVMADATHGPFHVHTINLATTYL